MSATPLLHDIRSAFQKAYDARVDAARKPVVGSSSSHASNNIRRGTAENKFTATARDDARRQLEGHLSFLCTSILMGGEQFVREFPAPQYVPLLIQILVAAHEPPAASARPMDSVANPLVWDAEEMSMLSIMREDETSRNKSTRKHKPKNASSALPVPYLGFQLASPIELLGVRALALIAGDVPRGAYALRRSKNPEAVPVLAAYLTDTDFMVVNDELTEEVLKCFLYLSSIAHDRCAEANVPRRVVELLLVVEQHHLRVLCLQILSNLLARSRESDLADIWSPVMALLMDSFDGFLSESVIPRQAGSPERFAARVHGKRSRLNNSMDAAMAVSSPTFHGSTSAPSAAASPSTATSAAASRTLTSKELTLLQHYVEAITHALDRLFVHLATLQSHARLIDHFVEVSVHLLRASLRLTHATDGETVRSLSLSPLLTLYLANPAFAVPVLLRLKVWDAVCGCMLTLVERKQMEPTNKRGAAPPSPDGAATTGTVEGLAAPSPADASSADGGSGAVGREWDSGANAGVPGASRATSASQARSGGTSMSGEDGATGTSLNAGTSGLQNATVLASGPVLTTDVTTIPFIADELRLLPLLEFLLVLLPSARRGHAHADYRNTTAPYYRWTWEDDFHNETECNEMLCRRLERTYQQTRTFRTHERFAMTHGKQRVFFADFLSKTYVSNRKQQHSLHRRPLLVGYVHDSCNALLRGCTCGISEPDPLFTTWATRTDTQLRTAALDPSVHNGSAHSAENNGDTISMVTAEVDADTAEAQRASAVTVAGRGATAGHTRSSPASVPLRDVGDDASAGRTTASQRSEQSSSQRHRSLNGRGATLFEDEEAEIGGQGRSASNRRAAPAAAAATAAASALIRRNRAAAVSPATAAGAATSTGRSGAARPPRVPSNEQRRQVAFQDQNSADHFNGSVDSDSDSATSSRSGFSLYGGRRGGVADGVGCWMCGCGGQSSTVSRRSRQPMRLRVPGVDTSSAQSRKAVPVTVTMLPLKTMLEDPIERLQADPATRKAFLGKDVLSHLVPTVMPVLLSVLDNCVNPLVARHSVTLLLRCLSLCADLRTQVTGESIELTANIAGFPQHQQRGGQTTSSFASFSLPTNASENTTAHGASRDKPTGRFHSFRKWITGGGSSSGNAGHHASKWQRVEWQATQTALQCYVPSLRDVLVSLYLIDGIHFLAGRHDAFGAMKDDLVMTDELARLHIAPELSGFQLSLQSEQFLTTADAMVLLMGLFPVLKPRTVPRPSPAKPVARSKKNSVNGSFRRLQGSGSAPRFSPMQSVTSLHGSAQEFQRPLCDLQATETPATPSTGATATGAGAGAGAASAGDMKSPLPAAPSSPLLVSSRNEVVLHPERSTASAASSAFAPTGTPAGKMGAIDSTGKQSCCVFTPHQVVLLLNYARQMMQRAPRVCASARQVDESIQCNEFKMAVALGTMEIGAGANAASVPPLRSKELTLRIYPATGCPYHSTFLCCTETFFDASFSLLQCLIENGATAATPRTTTAGDHCTSGALSDPCAAAPPPLTSRPLPAVGEPKWDVSPLSPVKEGKVMPPPQRSEQPQQTPRRGAGEEDAASRATDASQRRRAPEHASRTPLPQEEEEDLAVDVTVSVVSKTIDVDALTAALDGARNNANTGAYCRLPKPLRVLLTFYDYCTEHYIEMRAVVTEMPPFMLQAAQELEQWHHHTMRRREDETLSPLYDRNLGSLSRLSQNSPSSVRHQLRFDSAVRGKLLRLVEDLGATLSRDLGPAALDLAPSIVTKQPSSFVKRARRMRSIGTVRHLLWQPLTVVFEMQQSLGSAGGEGWPIVTVRNVTLPVLPNVKVLKSTLAVLPSTTVGTLAAALAKQLQVQPSNASPHHVSLSSSQRRNVKPSPSSVVSVVSPTAPAPAPLHATHGRQSLMAQFSSVMLSDASPCLTSEEIFGDDSTSRSIAAERILLFINGVPMLSPLTTLLDGLTSYAESGAGLRHLVTSECSAEDSEEVHRANLLMALPALPFWFANHEVQFVVLAEPLPSALLVGDPITSETSLPVVRGCGCAGMEPNFLCSAKHLFDMAPVNGLMALYSILTTIAREEIADAAAVIDSHQRRLSSAVVHQLYHQLNMFMLPPLLYASKMGAATRGGSIYSIAATGHAHAGMAFPMASYAVWAYPFMFSMEMRVSLLHFFISAHSSVDLDQCKHLLARRTRTSDNASAQRDSANRALDVVGLQWLSEEVLRRRRVTITVDRNHILHSAEQLFLLATCTLTLDVAFKGEAGIGNGPAMEFYELIAEELLNPKRGLFRTEEIVRDAPDEGAERHTSIGEVSRATLASSPVSSSLVGGRSCQAASTARQPRRRCCAPLYPAAKQTPQSLHYWELLGVLLGRLLMLGETTSLSLHPLLLRRLAGEDIMSDATALVTSNLELLDGQLALSMRRLESMSAEDLQACDLYFTIPASEADGFSPATDAEQAMMEGGEHRPVTRENVHEYVTRLKSYYLQTVPDLALLYLRRGLQHTVNPLYLQLFRAEELGRLFGASLDAKIWETPEQFAHNIEAGHGYHKKSEVVQYLLEVVPQWSARLQHRFLKFVTGSSCVPYGGLTQAIKVVRRDIEASTAAATGTATATVTDAVASPTNRSLNTSVGLGGAGAATLRLGQSQSFTANTTAYDNTLPTVSTCFLYLKLPQYSSKAVMEDRLRFAICEGSNFFSLT